MTLQEAAARIAAVIAAKHAGTHWLLASDNDADGLCAAAVLALALRRVGHRFTVRASRDKTEAAYRALFLEPWDGLVLLDKGTSHAELIGNLAGTRTVLIVDHHNLVGEVPSNIRLLNPRAVGLDGSRDASAATTAEALALALCGETVALPWAPAALSGAVGDWQHMGGWQGWNLELVTRAQAAGHLRRVLTPAFIGVTLAEALSHAYPAIPGLDGDARASKEFLDSINVDPDAEVEELDADARTRLVSAVALRHMADGATPAQLERLVVPMEYNARLGASLRQVFRVVDACGREGQAATGIAYLMGDAAAKSEALACFARYQGALSDGLQVLREKGTQVRTAIQVAWTSNPDYTGMVAGVGMTHVVGDTERPLCILATRGDGSVQVSTRALHEHVRAGIDLGRACSAAAKAVGTEGGGHPVAAGAVIPAGADERFLAELDRLVVSQLQHRGAT